MQSFLPSYLELSLDSFTKSQERFANMGAGTLGVKAPSVAAYEEQVRQNMILFDRAMQMFNPFQVAGAATAAAKPAEPSAPAAAPEGEGELSELKKQMEAMRREIARLASKT
jgi:polyhydroxyalkanoate synthesis regulator protein